MTGTLLLKKVGYLNDVDVCIWASMAYWTAEEAIFLSLNISPKKDGEENDEANALEIGREYEIRDEMAGRAKKSGELKYIETSCISELPEGSEDNKEISYVPKVFVKWAIERFPNFPKKLYQAIKEKYPEEFVDTPEPVEIAPVKNGPSLRTDQKAKERCRAIAEMLWGQDKYIKTKDMIVRSEFEKYGHGGMFAPKTVYGWIKDLAPKNQKPGETPEEFDV